MNGDTNIQCLKGIGEKTYNGFKKLGVETVDSLITMYPRYYLTYGRREGRSTGEDYIGCEYPICKRIKDCLLSRKGQFRHYDIYLV